MKKFESVYFLELRLIIYKFFILALAMTAAFVILFYSIGINYGSYGFEWICIMSGYDKVSWISFIVCALMLIVSRVVNNNRTNYRYSLLRVEPKRLGWIQYLVTLTILLLWYAVLILDFILVGWLFTMNPGYSGGPNGVLCDFTIASVTRIVVPVSQPLRFLLNIGVLALVGLQLNIPSFNYMKKLKKEGKADEK